jgi:alpha-galactosidase
MRLAQLVRFCVGLTLPLTLPAAEVALTALDLGNLHVAGWSAARVDAGFSGKPLSIAGQKFAHGLGTRATTTLWLELDGRVERLTARVGVDDTANTAAAAIRVLLVGDGRKLWASPVLRRGDAAVPVDVSLTGIRSLLLAIDHAGESSAQDFADIADARFIFAGEAPRTVNAPREDTAILTPPSPAAPELNHPARYGCRPGHPFIFRIPATGARPMQFSAEGLPPSLKLDSASGIITGTAPARGTHAITLQARNQHGAATRSFAIVSGDTLALTPPMGWNHWYAHYNRVTDVMMREAVDVMVKTGMADVGYSYVCIDDCWMNAAPDAKRKPDPLRVGPFRDAAGNLNPNQHFPDMRALTDYIHARGLKAGIYSSPGPLTCGRYAASYQHEEQDAKQFAAWGFDFLKYDWCSYGQIAAGDNSLAMLQKPYRLMGELLRQSSRDMVFNLCQYGRGDVWEWGAEVGGHSWRTAGDLGGELNRIFPVALKNAEHRAWSKPGAWNDPDYIQIGFIGDARTNGEPKPCLLTATEQYSFMSLWSLMASPLFFSGDMSRLDAFTVNVLCNPEVIAIDQDPRGESARVVKLSDETFLMIKTLDDGSRAIGLCNGDEITRRVTANWSTAGVGGAQRVRDVWRRRDLGVFPTEYSAEIPRHGVVLLRLMEQPK